MARNIAQHLCKEIKGARGVMVPGVGHAWNLEASLSSPEQFSPVYQKCHYLKNWWRSKRFSWGSRSEKQRKSTSSDLAHRQHK